MSRLFLKKNNVQTQFKMMLPSEGSLYIFFQDYNAKLTDLAAHLSNRRSSCSSLPGIRESRVEETEQEASAYASPSFALLGVRTRSQERSNSFCMPLPKRHLLLGRGTLFHENENYSDGDEDASKPFGLSPLIQSSNPSSG